MYMKVPALPIQSDANKILGLYIEKKKSVAQIAKIYKCSQNKVNYYLNKFEIPKRSLSEAMYVFKNPNGDPFKLKKPENINEYFLYGLGLGLYWGEGTKRGDGGMRITNSDPKLLRKFIEFLEQFFNIDKNRLKFSIQIFDDIKPNNALEYWSRELNLNKKQFYKPTILKVRGDGTYKYKSEYGSVIMYFNNVKLKKSICEMIENIR